MASERGAVSLPFAMELTSNKDRELVVDSGVMGPPGEQNWRGTDPAGQRRVPAGPARNASLVPDQNRVHFAYFTALKRLLQLKIFNSLRI